MCGGRRDKKKHRRHWTTVNGKYFYSSRDLAAGHKLATAYGIRIKTKPMRRK